jgi:amino acid transporter
MTSTSGSGATPPTENDVLASFGYKQELERAMGTFSSFAVSFSGVSITAAIFLTISFVFTQAGSAGIWAWPISSAGALLVGLVFADLVGRIPVAGYAYQWSSRLTNPRFGWFVAVCGLIGFAVGCAGTIYGVTPYFLSEFGINGTVNAQIIGAAVLALIVLTINIAGIRLASRVNNIAVITELIGGVGISAAILISAIINHPHNIKFLFHQQPGAHGGYFGSFILAFLLGAFTYAAWELPADMAEETQDAPNIAAKTMLMSLVAVAVAGMLLLVGYSYAAPSVGAIANSTTPVLDVINYQWGSTAKDIIDILFLISFVAVCLVIMAGAARLLYSLSRDRMAPGSRIFSQVSDRFHTPHWALIGTTIFAIGMFAIPAKISATALSYVVGTASVGYNLVYMLVAGMFIYKVRQGTLPPSHGRFQLGRWAQLVGWAALIWQIFLVGTLTLPNINQSVGWTTLGMIGVGAIWYIVYVHRATGRGEAGPASGPAVADSAAAPETTSGVA